MKHPVKRNRQKLRKRARWWSSLQNAKGHELYGRYYREFVRGDDTGPQPRGILSVEAGS